MSNTVASLVRSHILGSGVKKAVMMYLADRASDDGSGVWTSKANISNDTEYGIRTVQNIIKEFCDRGLLIEVGKRSCRNGFTYEYRINLGAISALNLTRAGDAPVRERHPTPAGGAPHGVQEVHPNHPLTIHEPPIETARERPGRKVALPLDWILSVKNLEDARDHSFTDQEISHEADQFRDHHHARGTTFKDWDAAWRTWLRNARRFQGNRGLVSGPGSAQHRQAGGLAGAAIRRRARRDLSR